MADCHAVRPRCILSNPPKHLSLQNRRSHYVVHAAIVICRTVTCSERFRLDIWTASFRLPSGGKSFPHLTQDFIPLFETHAGSPCPQCCLSFLTLRNAAFLVLIRRCPQGHPRRERRPRRGQGEDRRRGQGQGRGAVPIPLPSLLVKHGTPLTTHPPVTRWVHSPSPAPVLPSFRWPCWLA